MWSSHLQRIALCLAAMSVFFFHACNDEEDEPKDTTAPQISFTNLTPDMKVRNTVSIKLEVSDLELSSIEVFIGNDLVATLTEPPYEVFWDSNLVPDGSYIVKVIATDKSGNTAEVTTPIIVANTLVTIDIAADQLASGTGWSQRGFVFLSDESGNVIASTEYTNENDVSLKSSSFDGDKFFLTEVLADDEGGVITWARAWTWPAIESGSNWVIYKSITDDVDYIEGVTLSFQNGAAQTNYNGSTNGGRFNLDEFTTSLDVSLRKSPSKVYVIRDSWADDVGPLGYGLFPGIVPRDNTIDLATVINPLTKVTATIPEGATYYSIDVTGYSAEGDYTDGYSVSSSEQGTEPNTVNIWYPGTAFPSYFAHHSFEMEGIVYYRGSNSLIGNFDIPEADVSFSFADSKLSYTAVGEFDFITTRFEEGGGDFRWVLYLPKGEEESVPRLVKPVGMEEVPLPAFGLTDSYFVYDFDQTSDYEDLKSFIRSTTRGADELYDNGANYLEILYSVPSAGGRVKSRAKGDHDLRSPGLNR